MICAPKGDKLIIKELQELCRGIEEQVEGMEEHKLLMIGDFNVKTGDQGKWVGLDVDKGGKELLRLI